MTSAGKNLARQGLRGLAQAAAGLLLAVLAALAGPVSAETLHASEWTMGCERDGIGLAKCGAPARLEPVVMSRGMSGRGPPEARSRHSTQVAPSVDPRLKAAQRNARILLRGADASVDSLRERLSYLRAPPWRGASDVVAWHTAPFAPEQVSPLLRDGYHLALSGTPSSALALRTNSGFNGVFLADLAFPPALVQRLLLAHYRHGQLASVTTWWGSVLVPLEEPLPRLSYLHPEPNPLFPDLPLARRRPAGSPLPPIAPIHLPVPAVTLGTALALLALLRRRGDARPKLAVRRA